MHVDIVSLKHHSLLHLEKCNPIIPLLNNQEQDPNISPMMITPTIDNNSEPSIKFSGTVSTSSTIVLGTAVIRILNNYGQWVQVRSLIDSGSQISVMTNACLVRLGLPRHRGKNVVVGLSHTFVAETKGITIIVF